VVHLALFGVLTLTGAFGRLPRTRMGVGLVAYAVGSELLQGQLPIGRKLRPVRRVRRCTGRGARSAGRSCGRQGTLLSQQTPRRAWIAACRLADELPPVPRHAALGR
jgi:hypothetical protein